MSSCHRLAHMLRSIAGKSPGTTGFSSMVGATAVGELLSLHGCRTGPGTGRAGPSADKAIRHNRGGAFGDSNLGFGALASESGGMLLSIFQVLLENRFVALQLPVAAGLTQCDSTCRGMPSAGARCLARCLARLARSLTPTYKPKGHYFYILRQLAPPPLAP